MKREEQRKILEKQYQEAVGRVNVDVVQHRVALISAVNDWQQVRARGEEVEINALLDITLKAMELVKKLVETRNTQIY